MIMTVGKREFKSNLIDIAYFEKYEVRDCEMHIGISLFKWRVVFRLCNFILKIVSL